MNTFTSKNLYLVDEFLKTGKVALKDAIKLWAMVRQGRCASDAIKRLNTEKKRMKRNQKTTEQLVREMNEKVVMMGFFAHDNNSSPVREDDALAWIDTEAHLEQHTYDADLCYSNTDGAEVMFK